MFFKKQEIEFLFLWATRIFPSYFSLTGIYYYYFLVHLLLFAVCMISGFFILLVCCLKCCKITEKWIAVFWFWLQHLQKKEQWLEVTMKLNGRGAQKWVRSICPAEVIAAAMGCYQPVAIQAVPWTLSSQVELQHWNTSKICSLSPCSINWVRELVCCGVAFLPERCTATLPIAEPLQPLHGQM